MLTAVQTGFTAVLSMLGTFVSSLTGASGQLNPLLDMIGMGIALGVVGWGIRSIKSLVWGF